MMKLSEIREILAREEIRLTKSLGQNFLHDANQLRRIVAAAGLTKADRVLEIGPGLGALTESLVERAGEVLAIEKDRRLVELLKARFEGRGGVLGSGSRARSIDPARKPPASGPLEFRLLHDDALRYLQREQRDWSRWKLVANLPYSIASPILVELAAGERAPRLMVATLQLEVAKRLMAKAGEKDYGVLTLLVGLDFEPCDWFRIPAGCFFPAPEVDSACVCLARRSRPLLDGAQRAVFVQIVRRAFSQRRKMMLKLLKNDWPATALAKAYSQAGLDPQTRAEQVGANGFVQLTLALHASPCGCPQ